MTEQEVQEIYERLLDLTKAGAIQWKKTGEKEFTTSFSRSSVTTGEESFPEVQAAFKIFNDAGIMVAYASPNIGLGNAEPSAKEFVLDPAGLFNLVQEKVYKYSETSENILHELRKLKASQLME
jgi:hypothetical protein